MGLADLHPDILDIYPGKFEPMHALMGSLGTVEQGVLIDLHPDTPR